MLLRTSVHVRRAYITLAAGYTEFDVDPSILKLQGIKRGENWLQEQDLDELDEYGFAFAGYNRLAVGAPGTGDQILVFYTPTPTPMTADAHDPSAQTYGLVPTQFHPALVNYMAWHSADKAGDQQVGRGERYRVLYEGQDGLGMLGSDLGRIRAHTNMRGGAARVIRYRAVLKSDTGADYWVG